VTEHNPRREQIIRAAWLYHERGLNQQAVAERLEVSRSTVSRLLADAERLGIVRVTLTEPLPETGELSERLIERFGLAGATVEVTLEGESPLITAATAMARRLEHMVANGPVTIATGWGRTLGTAAQLARSMHTAGVTIVDAFGHTTTNEIANAVEVSNTLGLKFGARVMHIPSPGFAPNAAVAASFYETEPVAATLELAKAADAVMVAVGVVGADSLLVSAGYIDDVTMREVIGHGAVGEIFGRYFDEDGELVLPDALHPISLTFDDLFACNRVIAAVGGADKTDAVRGALATGVINELAIDDTLARALLA
jgi:deoxyribonucleoside regulator